MNRLDDSVRRTLRRSHLLVACGLGGMALASPAAPQEPVVHRVVFQDADGELVDVLPRLGRRPFLGVGTVDLTPELREHLGAPRERGVLVSAVTEGSPAERAGVAVGDVVTRLGEESIDSVLSLIRALSRHAEGESTVLEAWRGGRLQQLDVTLEEHEMPSFDVGPLVFRSRHGAPGRLLTIGPGEFRELPLDPERLHRLGSELGERLRSPEWGPRLDGHGPDSQALEARIHELEERLQELERELHELVEDEE
jgi:membrane-associated protease RseP (regulator of RpoE activity)